MPLVDYSSDDSASEDKPTQTVSTKSKPNTIKPAFQKVIDPSNPHKIRVNLPDPAKPQDPDEPERPSKRAKVGSGGLSGFNALLPAPKRAAASNRGPSVNDARRHGLGSGVNLKTGAAPGFTREPAPSAHTDEEGDQETAQGGETQAAGKDQDISKSLPLNEEMPSLPKPVEDPKPKGKATMFKPLSVARKPQKKRITPRDGTDGTKTTNYISVQESKSAPKLSLFSTGEAYDTSKPEPISSETYQPMIYSADVPDTETPPETPSYLQDYTETTTTLSTAAPNTSTTQTLTTIASDLNLSASQRRQLLGRHHQHSANTNPAHINIVDFNTDAEYAANEILRQAGESAQHNPVRAIAPGKHSLKQLVNAASNQKDALEESFASGRRNKKEAGSKYGW